MDICICQDSAVEFWRGMRLEGPSFLAHMRLAPHPSFSTQWRQAASPRRIPELQIPSEAWLRAKLLNDDTLLSAPIDLFASPGERRSHCLASHSHCRPSNLKPKDLLAVTEHVYVTNPARTLLDMGRRLSRCEFLMLVSEFCGGYAIDIGCARG